MSEQFKERAYREATTKYETLAGGDPSAFHMAIRAIVTKTETISLASPGVTLVVGPNNSGKSTLLRETYESLNRDPWTPHDGGTILVDTVILDCEGTAADAFAWLLENNPIRSIPYDSGLAFVSPSQFWSTDDPNGQHITIGSVADHAERLPQESAPLGSLASLLFFYASTDSRLRLSHPAPARANARDGAFHPVHALADNRETLARISDLAEDAFHETLMLDDYSAEQRLRVGSVETDAPKRDEPDAAYRGAVLGLPELVEQGDGMRSFLGLILPLLTTPYSAVLVDEPEAFLHPPQANALGRALGKISRLKNLQIVVATHDRNLLAGALESGVPLTVVRVDRFREDETRHIHQIDPQEVQEVWNEPSLRFTNLLDGLFCRLVVLVEADDDARFYTAALESLNRESKSPTLPLSEVLFVPCGGKGGMAKAARALKKLGVLVVASPDLDVLRDKGELKSIVEAFGGNWNDDFSANYTDATSGVSKRSEGPSRAAIKGIIDAAMIESDQSPLDRETIKALEREIKRTNTGWDSVKNSGEAALFSNAKNGPAAQRLLSSLDDIGIVPLRVGQLESLAPELGVAKGPGWLPAALGAFVHEKPAAIAHIKKLLKAGKVPQAS